MPPKQQNQKYTSTSFLAQGDKQTSPLLIAMHKRLSAKAKSQSQKPSTHAKQMPPPASPFTSSIVKEQPQHRQSRKSCIPEKQRKLRQAITFPVITSAEAGIYTCCGPAARPIFKYSQTFIPTPATVGNNRSGLVCKPLHLVKITAKYPCPRSGPGETG